VELAKHHPEGMLITRIAYGAGLPLDRLKPIIETLLRLELLSIDVKGLPLRTNLLQRRFYHVTRKGLEFLETYKKIKGLTALHERID
jgi:predicted transcriptional regulator